MATSSLIKTITTFSLFQGFSPEEVWKILAAGKVGQLKPGEILISPGTANDTLFLLIDGELSVVLEKKRGGSLDPDPAG
ncbi:MAG: hypothetical protein IPL49_17915 [Saprospirales bacterium]|nr:hypothetical protein [Saprospirales bacterium]